jgi:hypothetical protein
MFRTVLWVQTVPVCRDKNFSEIIVIFVMLVIYVILYIFVIIAILS